MTETTFIYRQVHPSFFQNGQVSSQAFRPIKGDDLSVYDGDLIAAEQAWIHYTQTQKLKSAGAMALIVGECRKNDLPVVSSPEEFKEHAHIDFGGLDKKQRIDKSKILATIANQRGWAYKAEI